MTPHEAWNSYAHENIADQGDRIVHTLEKPMTLKYAVTHKVADRDHGTPSIREFSKPSSRAKFDLKIPVGTQVVLDRNTKKIYTSHPDHGFVQSNLSDLEDTHHERVLGKLS